MHFLDTEEVTGSNPVPPIFFIPSATFPSQLERLLGVLAALPSPDWRAKVKTSPLTIRKPQCSLATLDLARYCEGWLLACDIAEHSQQTLNLRKIVCDKLLWFLRSKEIEACGTLELRQFFSYLKHGHEQPGGRWGNPQQTRPVKSGTIATYDRHIRTLFSWLVKEEAIDVSPMDKVDEPVDRPDQIEPFTDEESVSKTRRGDPLVSAGYWHSGKRTVRHLSKGRRSYCPALQDTGGKGRKISIRLVRHDCGKGALELSEV